MQNELSFRLRSCVRASVPVCTDDPSLARHHKLQTEMATFLEPFRASIDGRLQKKTESHVISICDVGCRDFSFAPVWQHFFQTYEESHGGCDIYGVEIDAYRRFTNGRSRADYAKFYAKQISENKTRGYFLPKDFRRVCLEFDMCFMLHPFVTPEPPLRWGLPLSLFCPQEMFNHARHVLMSRRGLLLLSCPSKKELQIALGMATKAGFTCLVRSEWNPSPHTAHQKPRLGLLMKGEWE